MSRSGKPISALPLVASAIDGMLEGTREQYRRLEHAGTCARRSKRYAGSREATPTGPAVLTDDPFGRCFERCRQLPDETAYRLQLAHRYSYVLSEPRLLSVVHRYAPLVEVGAGTGYWAYRLRLMGADVVAYDQAPPGGGRPNRYHPDVGAWTEVLEGDATVLAAHRDRALFLCWPPAFSALWEALDFYAGDFVIYVGDWGPRTARLAGLDTHFERLEVHPALALEPEVDRAAELSAWRRRVPARRRLRRPGWC